MSVSIGKTIQWFRNKNNMSQQVLADLIYKSDKTISSYEQERNEPDLKTLQEMAKVFQVSLSEMIRKAEGEIEMKKSFFFIGTPENKWFEGYVAGPTWKGFSSPAFTKETAEEIVEDFNDYGKNMGLDSYRAWYDKEEEAFFFQEQEGEEPLKCTGEIYTDNGEEKELFLIGNGMWMWEEEEKR